MVQGLGSADGGLSWERQKRCAGARRCVWVVEDDDQIRELIAAVLVSEDYEVVELADGMEAVNHLAAAEVFPDQTRPPDLVVADLLMPNFSGIDLLAGMRESALSPPVLVVTAVRDEAVRREARRLGAERIVSKPFDVETLLHNVEHCIDAPRRQPTSVVREHRETPVPNLDS